MIKNIGFGCVKLTSNLTRGAAIRNLETAYDNGVRHFDAARLYGFGLAEGLLGEFIQDKRDQLTITTKMGILPNGALLRNLFLQNMVRSVFRMMKKLPGRKSAQNLAGQSMKKSLALPEMKLSLETSLKELKTDYIDYLLLHEAFVTEANNDEVINFLNEKKKEGLIGAYGLGSFTDKLEGDFKLLNKGYSVLQTDNSFPMTVPAEFLNAGHITKRFYFSPLQNLGKLKQALKDDNTFATTISEKLGMDVQAQTLDLFLMQQRFSDPNGTMLFTSSKNDKIKNTISRWDYVQALPEDAFTNFAEVREMIRQKLATQN